MNYQDILGKIKDTLNQLQEIYDLVHHEQELSEALCPICLGDGRIDNPDFSDSLQTYQKRHCQPQTPEYLPCPRCG